MSVSDINKGASGVNPTSTSILPSQDGNSGKVLGTDGSNVSWVSGGGPGGSPGGSNTQVQFNDAGSFGGDSGLTYNKTTNNLTTNSLFNGFTSVAASGTLITLTAASTPNYVVTGSGGQIIQLPDATTLPKNANIFSFNNNQTSGAITVNNNSSTLVASIPSGGYVSLSLLDTTLAAGSWDRHDQAPANVSWSTNTFDYAGSFTSGTWNGNTVQVNRGGTGAATLTGYVKGNGTAAMTAAGSVPVGDLSGLGTGVATALAVNVGTAGAPVVNGGALGTPSSGVATNLTGTASGLTAGNVTTNANLTGAVTSIGNATSLGSFTSAQLLAALTNETGTGTAVFSISPALTGTPTAPTATAGTNTTQLATTAFVTTAVATITNNGQSGSIADTATSGIIIYEFTGAGSLTLPTAVANKAIFMVKNRHSADITVTFTGGQNADGSTSISISPYQALQFISNNTNYNIF
jgi:hypothetical protein